MAPSGEFFDRIYMLSLQVPLGYEEPAPTLSRPKLYSLVTTSRYEHSA